MLSGKRYNDNTLYVLWYQQSLKNCGPHDNCQCNLSLQPTINSWCDLIENNFAGKCSIYVNVMQLAFSLC